jgi:hypothetical protein
MKTTLHITFRHVWHISVMLVILFALLAGAATIWVATGERSIPFLNSYLEAVLQSRAPGMRVEIGSHTVSWPKREDPLTIQASHVRVLDENGDTLAFIPKFSLGLDVKQLVRLKPVLRGFSIVDPVIYIPSPASAPKPLTKADAATLPSAETHVETLTKQPVTEETTSLGELAEEIITLNDEPAPAVSSREYMRYLFNYYEYLMDMLTVLSDTQHQNMRLQYISLTNGKIILPQPDGKWLVWYIKEIGGSTLTNDEATRLTASLSSTLGTEELPLKLQLAIEDEDVLSIRINFKDLTLQQITQRFPASLYDSFKFLKDTTLTADGWVSLRYDESEATNSISLHLENASGVFVDDSLFPEPVPFNQLEANIDIAENFSLIHIRNTSVYFDKSRLTAEGTFNFGEDAIELDTLLTAYDVPVDRVKVLWPKPVEPAVREWVTTHIYNGFVPKAHVHISLHAPNEEGKKATLRTLDSDVHFEDATLNYFSELPTVDHLYGTAHFDSKIMRVTFDKGSMLGTQIAEGQVLIPDFYQMPHSILEVSGKIKGPLNDLTHFYEPGIKKKTPVLQADLQKTRGHAATTLNLSFPIKPEHEHYSLDDFSYNLSSSVRDAALPGILGRLDGEQGTFDLSVTPENVTLDGRAMLGSIPTTFRLEKTLGTEEGEKKQQGHSAKYLFKSHIAGKELATFGFPAMPFIQDRFLIGVAVTEDAEKTDILVTADLTDTAVNWETLHWSKAKGEPLLAEADLFYLPKSPVKIRNFTVNSKDFSAQGEAMLSEGFSSLQYLMLDPIRVGRTDLRARFVEEEGRYQLLLSGKSLDLANVSFNNLLHGQVTENAADQTATDQASSPDTARHMDIRANIDKIYMKEDEAFYKLTGNLFCAFSGCVAASLDAELPDSHYVSITYQPMGTNKHSLVVESNNGGAVLRALGIFNNAQGGALRIDAQTRIVAKSKKHMLEGEGILRDFVAIKTPVLTKVLSLVSFTGIRDLVQQKGIPFQRFSVPFAAEDGIVTIRDASGHGESLGITVAGKINTTEGNLDLEGTLVPASSVNRAIQQVPVIGNVLTGGKGEGVIAARYKVSGSYLDPSVFVNPLSIVTPGVLRKIFDVF